MPLAEAEAVLRTWLDGRFDSARVVTRLPADLTGALPVICVNRRGGADALPVLDTAVMSVDVYHSTVEDARALAEQVRTSVRSDLPSQTIGSAFVAETGTQQAPVGIPYDNPGVSRCTASYVLAIRSIP